VSTFVEETQYGKIKLSQPGPFNDPPYDNVNIYHQTEVRYIQLQGPAIRAFKAAEEKLGHRILITGHGYRSYATQRTLWLGDKKRFANPDNSMHVEALAVDVDQSQKWRGLTVAQTLNKIRKALEAEHWHYGVSGEPWHASYGVVG